MTRRLFSLALAAALLVACDGGNEDRATPSPTVVATESVSPTSAPVLATNTPVPIASPLLEPDVYAHLPHANGILSLDPVAGEVTEVWGGSQRIWSIEVYARLATGGDGVWLSWDESEESVRYDLHGNEVDRVPGLFATESPDGSVVAYLADPYGSDAHLVVRDDNYGPVDLGMSGGAAAPHDDGRVAFLSRSSLPGDGGALSMYNPATGETNILVEFVGRPGKEGVLYPVWSPSGRFISEWSHLPGSADGDHALLVDTRTGQVNEAPEPYVWVEGPAGDDWYALIDDGALLFIDAATGEEARRVTSDAGPLVPKADLGGAFEAWIGERVGAAVTISGIIVVDLAGNELARWEGQHWHAVMTPQGPAAYFVDTKSKADCPPGRVEHPDFEGDLNCIGHDQAWSPDARFLAMNAILGARSSLLVLDTQTGETLVADVGRSFGFEWSDDGTRIMLRLGGGL